MSQSNLYTKQAVGSLDEVAERLSQAVQAHQYGVLGSIDLHAKMNEKGVPFDRDCQVFEVCNPGRAKKVLDQQMGVSTVLPCRISLYEDGGVLHLSTLRPTVLIRAFEAPALQEEAAEVEADLISIIDQAAEA